MDFNKFIYFNIDDNKVVQSFDELTNSTRMVKLYRFNDTHMDTIILSVIRDKLYIHQIPFGIDSDSKSMYIHTLQSMNTQLVVIGYIPHGDHMSVFTV
jgi:hypothetical protein